MVRSNTFGFCIVVLTMVATYCAGWPEQQNNPGTNLFMERRSAKREFQAQLFGEVDASRRLPRTILRRRIKYEPGEGEGEGEGVKTHKIPSPPAPNIICPCPCGPDSYNVCPHGCKVCGACPCPCGYYGYACPTGCRTRSTCGG